jgi:CheY-like chemotaxis protein
MIDDDPLLRALVCRLLKRDYTVHAACDGVEGFLRAKSFRPEAAIIDMQMPKWCGLKTLRAFRGNPVLRPVPILFLTADTSRHTVTAAIADGANDYMPKAILTRAELCRRLERLLGNGTAPRPNLSEILDFAAPLARTVG